MAQVLVAHSGPTLCDPMDYGPPGFSVHGILQARILEWVAMTSPGGLPDPGVEPGPLHCKQIFHQVSYPAINLNTIPN